MKCLVCLYSYSSGRTAVICIDAPYSDGDLFPSRDQAFYTLIYSDDPEPVMLALFTPYGRTTIYDSSGKVLYIR